MIGTLALVALIAAVISARRTHRRVGDLVGHVLRSSGAIAVGTIVLIAIGALVDFDWFWSFFHRVLFPQGNYEFSSGSAFHGIYGPSYFQAFVMYLTVAVAITGVLCILIGRRSATATTR
ncbi:MAG: lipoprotein intramolecular transacylase Lit [Actinomycetota bacterium]